MDATGEQHRPCPKEVRRPVLLAQLWSTTHARQDPQDP